MPADARKQDLRRLAHASLLACRHSLIVNRKRVRPGAARKHNTLKNYYPNQLIQRPDHQPLAHCELRPGDRVTLHPASGDPVTSIVRVVVAMFGCTTYTSEIDPDLNDLGARAPARFRFRLQDVHHAEPAW